jgi:phenylalanyl-tRNA synthetase beta subunit
LNDLAKSLNLELDFRPVTSKDDGDYLKPFELHRSAIVSIAGQKNIVGVVGEYKTSVRRNFKLPDFCGGFEININALFEATQKTTSHYQPLSRFPKVTQDITLKTPVKNGFGKTESALIGKLKKYLPKETIFSLEPASIYQAKPTEKTINYSFKMQIVNYERTLTDKEVNKILDKISTELKTDYQIERV